MGKTCVLVIYNSCMLSDTIWHEVTPNAPQKRESRMQALMCESHI